MRLSTDLSYDCTQYVQTVLLDRISKTFWISFIGEWCETVLTHQSKQQAYKKSCFCWFSICCKEWINTRYSMQCCMSSFGVDNQIRGLIVFGGFWWQNFHLVLTSSPLVCLLSLLLYLTGMSRSMLVSICCISGGKLFDVKNWVRKERVMLL